MRIVLLLVLAALAGCFDTAEAPELEATDVPQRAAVGQSFTFQLNAADLQGSSDHIGGHYWNESTSDPSADFGDQAGACEHLEGVEGLPGTFNVTCTFTGAGDKHLRAHVRQNGTDYWSQEFTVGVVDIDLRIENASSTAAVDADLSFDLHVEGTSASSDHAGAHYWSEATDDPQGDFDEQAGACDHQEETVEVPNVLEVTCNFDAAGTYHVYGHVRLDDLDLWSSGHIVVVV